MAAGSSGFAADRPHLLVVDDDRETRDLLSMYFREQGFDVDTVKDGADMDAWLANHATSLVILDLMLPGEDGLSLARRLRADHKLPIVMISARGEEIDRIIGLENFGFQFSHPAVETENGRLAYGDMNITGTLFHTGLQEFVN